MNENTPESADDVIFSKSDKPNFINAYVLLGAPLIAGAYWLPKSQSPAEALGNLFALMLMALFGICVLVDLLWKGKKTITLRRNSLTIENHGVEKSYLLESIESLQRIRNKYTGATQIDAAWFYKIKMMSGEKIKFQTNDSLPHLMKTFGKRLSAELSKKLLAKGSVQWVPGVTILQDGIKLMIPGIVSRKKLLTWKEIKEIQLESEYASVFVPTQTRPVAKIKCSHQGFFPGYDLFQKLHDASQQVDDIPIAEAVLA